METERARTKLSWSELKGVVSDLRRQLSTLSSMVPTNISFRTLQDGRTRIYFLSTPQNGWETTLLYADVPTLNHQQLPLMPSSTDAGRLQWHSVIEANFPSLSTASGKFSREEQLLWERKRLATWGINTYEIHGESGKIVFPAASSLFQCIDSGYTNGPLFPTKLRMIPSGAKLNPQICPSNPDLVAYICNHDIWLTHTQSGCNVRLTYAHKGGRNLADDPLCAGVPSYVMQEEFCRFQGYWWQPKSPGRTYRILYEEVDDGDVKIFCFPSSHSEAFSSSSSSSSSSGSSGSSSSSSIGGAATGSSAINSGETEEFRFPRAGCPNSKSHLKMVEFKVNEMKQIVDVCVLELQYSLAVLFPWMEYVVRVGWTPCSEFIWVQLLDRRQQRLDLVLLSLSNFTEVLPLFDDMDCTSNTNNSLGNTNCISSPIVQVIYSQESCVWVNVHDLLYFLPPQPQQQSQQQPRSSSILDFHHTTSNHSNNSTGSMTTHSEVQFIWASEETGFRHLYLITAQIVRQSSNSNGTASLTETSSILPPMDYVFLQPKVLSKVALTHGEWEVLGQNIWVDTEKQLVYFMGLKETPLEKHLYVVSLRRPGEVRLLTRPGYSYSVDFNKECSMIVSVYSNIQKPPVCQVFRINHADWTIEGVSLQPVGYLMEASPVSPNEFYSPELYTHEIQSGHVLYAMVFKPHDFQQGKRYPTVLNVYGGPEVQLVSNSYKGMRLLRTHMLAARGYCVVSIDSRGSQHRGLSFESHIKGRMGTVELHDQVEVLKWLADTLNCIDLTRVAIHGWSYGGYLSLMGLAQYPQLFKIAIAGAPVTNWKLYDTGYTERYMDLPDQNPQGYTEGSVLNYVAKFPEEENRLLIIHGLIDENVHFYHTSQLISCMIRAGKPYQLQIYPNERHSLRHIDASKHYETTLLSFLQNHL